VLLLCVARSVEGQERSPRLTVLGTFRAGPYNEGAAEIVAHDPASQRLFVVNGADRTIDILDMRTPSALRRISQIAIPPDYGRVPNSVAVRNGVVAVAVEANPKTEPGFCVFFDTEGRFQKAVRVGALPDMLTFTPDGRKIVVANEGEPSEDYQVDPEGSVSIIDMAAGLAGVTQDSVRTVRFSGFTRSALDPAIRIFGPNASVAQDLEPEFVAVSPDSRTAYVTLQENNAVAVLDLDAARFTRIFPLGLKEHWHAGNELDASDRDGRQSLRTWTVWGMYQPDAIAAFAGRDGQVYLITANEGDAREWGNFVEPARVASLRLDPETYPNAAELQLPENLGRLNVSTASGDYDRLHVFGARSMSVWSTTGELLWDSHNQFEAVILAERPAAFNVSNTDNTVDSRSDDKGPEPEAVAVGTIRGTTYAFIANERSGNIMIYDMTAPRAPRFAGTVWNRNVNAAPNTAEAGDLGPEDLIFIAEADSPTGKPLLVAANEISGTTTVWEID
jgi:DNA-binding beta-propeller fold protein YncE